MPKNILAQKSVACVTTAVAICTMHVIRRRLTKRNPSVVDRVLEYTHSKK